MTRDTSDKFASSGKYLSGCEMDDGRRKEPSTTAARGAAAAVSPSQLVSQSSLAFDDLAWWIIEYHSTFSLQ